MKAYIVHVTFMGEPVEVYLDGTDSNSVTNAALESLCLGADAWNGTEERG